VIDSGLDVTHAEFAGRPNTTLMNPQRFDESDGEYHGTAVSSVAAAPENGVGVVGVYPQAVLRMWDAGAPVLSRVIQGIDAAIEAGAGVINISLGFSENDRMLADAVLQAFGTGSLVVAAAGNDRRQGSPATFPANLNHVLTVAATDEADNPSGFSNESLGVDLAAPGQNIPAAIAFDGWQPVAGTSFAAPLVAGAAAWVWTVRPQLDPTQIFDLMRLTARDVGAQGFDASTGFGILDLPSALSAAAPASDGQEPNDDIEHVKANGLFRHAARPLTTASRRRATINRRLDSTEDPEDIYRVWVPAGRVVRAAVTPTTDVDVDVWKASTPSVLLRGNARRRYLLTSSTKVGRVVERVTVRNRTRRGFFVYLDVYLRRNGPLDAEYRVSLSTARR
jgi:subtilisin family serine protease